MYTDMFIRFATVVIILAATGVANAATYYVDGNAGNDSNPGTLASPWRSLTKVNNTTYAPGDTILLRRGSVWQGLLAPCASTHCSGTAAAPIKIDSYDTGTVSHGPPQVNGAGSGEATLYMLNQSYWEIRNLEITNTGPTGFHYVGIQLVCSSTTAQVCHHVYIGYNTVHGVNGILHDDSGGGDDFYGRNGGIAVDAEIHNPIPNRWDDVKIEGNSVYAVDRIGIYVGPYQQLSTDTADLINGKPKTTTSRSTATPSRIRVVTASWCLRPRTPRSNITSCMTAARRSPSTITVIRSMTARPRRLESGPPLRCTLSCSTMKSITR